MLKSADTCDPGSIEMLDRPVIFGSAATSKPLRATHKGRLTIPSCCAGVADVVLEDCYIVPNIPANLISGVKLQKDGYIQLIDTNGCIWIYRRTNGQIEACCGFQEKDERFLLRGSYLLKETRRRRVKQRGVL